jgi:vancomycin permeability regulator SanA
MAVFLFALFLLLFLTLFISWIHTFPLKRSGGDVLIILGYKCVDNKIHPFLEERLIAAIQLLKSYHFEKVIVTGGQVGSSISEAEIMRTYLVKNGVEKERILLENEAMDTIENLVNCRKLMEAHQLKTCTIISNSFHLRRIHYIACSIGFYSGFYCDRNLKTIVKQGIRTLNELRLFFKTFRLLEGITRKEGEAR